MENLVKQNAIETAVDLTKTLQKIRNYYAEYVLDDISQQQLVTVTHLHKQSRNSIPIPATFLMEMAQSQPQQDKLSVDIISPYPFEARKDRKLDSFQNFAWQQLAINSDTPVSRFDLVNNRQVVKVALPDKLTSMSCVNCHNSHPDSIKRDWQLGDVRGLVEITVDVEQSLKRANQVSTSIILVCFIAFLMLVIFNLRLARKIVQPLRNMTGAISALSERKFLSTKSKHKDYAEVKALSRALVRLQNNEIKRQQLETEVHNLAYFDRLSQLPNRAAMVNYLTQLLQNSTSSECVGLILVNIEKFNEVNDTLGYDIGDKALIAISKRLVNIAAEHFVSHFNTTEFAICCISDESEIAKLADSIMTIVQQPVLIEENEISLCISIGITVVKDGHHTVEDTISQANIALHKAVQTPTASIVKYSQQLAAALNKRVETIKQLKVALEQQQLVPYFQPQLDLKTNKIVGAEVLLRWQKPDGSLVPPFEFIPIAEKSRLILPIGKQVLFAACQLTKAWQEQGIAPFRVAVNVSGVQFEEDDIVENVKQVLAATGLAPNWLELEVTETALMSDMDEIINKLSQLRDLGIELAIDDFGTGYSSLNYLKKLPIHRLKIDQSFVTNVIQNKDDQAIIEAILSLGKTMKLNVLAEGVEDESQKEYLTSLGCDEAQGYYYARPMPAHEFEQYLKNFSAEQ